MRSTAVLGLPFNRTLSSLDRRIEIDIQASLPDAILPPPAARIGDRDAASPPSRESRIILQKGRPGCSASANDGFLTSMAGACLFYGTRTGFGHSLEKIYENIACILWYVTHR
jgi:hypothetical protein